MERKFIDTLKEKNNKAYEQLEEDLKTELEYIGIPQKPKGQIPYVLIRHVDDIDKDTLNKFERPHPTDVGWGFYGLAPVKPR